MEDVTSLDDVTKLLNFGHALNDKTPARDCCQTPPRLLGKMIDTENFFGVRFGWIPKFERSQDGNPGKPEAHCRRVSTLACLVAHELFVLFVLRCVVLKFCSNDFVCGDISFSLTESTRYELTLRHSHRLCGYFTSR